MKRPDDIYTIQSRPKLGGGVDWWVYRGFKAVERHATQAAAHEAGQMMAMGLREAPHSPAQRDLADSGR